MADYTVTETYTTWDGNYTAAGLGYIHWVTDHYELATGSGTRQYYTLDGDSSYIMVYDIDTDNWVLTETASFPYDYNIYNTSTTPPVDTYWGAAYVEAYSAPTYDREGENDLELNHEAEAHGGAFNVSASNGIAFGQDNYLTYDEEGENDLELSQENTRLRLVYRDGSASIEFSDSANIVHLANNELNISHSAAASSHKPAGNDLELSDSAIREAMTFARSASNSLEFVNYAAAFDENGLEHGICDDEYTCDRDHITLSCADPALSIDLRNPSTDSLGVILNTINRYSRAEELRMVGVHPRFLQLHYDFTAMPASQKADFIDFYKQTAGLEITLIDFCSQEWIGCILDKEIGFDREAGHIELDPLCPETDDGQYAWSFIFEGERV